MLKTKLTGWFAAAALLALAVPMWAHHSFAAEFDGNKPVRLQGILTKIEWTNPHSYFYIDVTDDKGNVVNWGCEGGGRARCRGAGSRRATSSWATRLWWMDIARRTARIWWTRGG